MSQPNAAELLRRGTEAAQGGNRDGARHLFQQAVAADPHCLDGWLWLGILAATPEQATGHFYEALGVDGSSPAAKTGLEWALAWSSEAAAPALPSDLEALTRRVPPPPAPEPDALRIQFDPALLTQLDSLGPKPAEPSAEAAAEGSNAMFEEWLRGLRPKEEPLEPATPAVEPIVCPEQPPPQPPPAAQEEPSLQPSPAAREEPSLQPPPAAHEEPPIPAEAPPPPEAMTEPLLEPPVEEGPPPEAAAEMEEASVAAEPSPQELASRGEAALAEERWNEAAAALQGLVAQAPSGEAHQKLGLALYQTGQKEAALAQFEAAAQLEPELAEPHANLGFILQESGQLERAEESLAKSLARNPSLAEAQVALAEVLTAEGKLEAAVNAWQAAATLRPDLPQLQVGLGDAWSALGNRKAAATAYERALASHPNLPGVADKLKAVAESASGKGLFGLFSRGKR